MPLKVTLPATVPAITTTEIVVTGSTCTEVLSNDGNTVKLEIITTDPKTQVRERLLLTLPYASAFALRAGLSTNGVV